MSPVQPAATTRGAQTRTALVAAASDLLWERGYAGASPAMIQERAGVGRGTMYHHFTSKADLAAVALRRSTALLRAAAEGALDQPGPVLDRIRRYLTLERAPLMGCRVGRLVQDYDVVTDPNLRAPAEEFFLWLEQRIHQVLEEGVARGELRADADTGAAAALVAASVQGGYVLARAHQDPEAFNRATRGALHAVENLLAAPAAPAAGTPGA
ncbi:TetR/AcrR family transcriptional regulator [Streptacidiphilus sp. P02-A3a]|uniref:TetR/AcrR family transcriptional regulator n=1 Tax=Streptacidiphilus sp. P02-A3a TaxID=2704468 RepID=UPI0015F9C05E|nr:TetR/AcrR family transcriptional regulator [Streptacidiphilus sp. P02-A3a]QMU71251.1 TetR/AcrR family transcriptional regulator [Streptacidiphilus sp. P02-A3a]